MGVRILQGARFRYGLAIALLPVACQKSTPPSTTQTQPPTVAMAGRDGGTEPPIASASPTAELSTPEVTLNSALLFTYADPTTELLATTDDPLKVPELVRHAVRIMSQGKGGPRRRNDKNVEMIDLRELLAKGKAQPRVVPREAFESQAFAQLPPGESCPLSGPHGPPLPRPTTAPPQEPPVALIYSTAWCGVDDAVRRYLVTNRIPFTVNDIEKDPTAAREMKEKASRFGIAVDRVPVLDVRGRLLVGYSEKRVDGYLGDW